MHKYFRMSQITEKMGIFSISLCYPKGGGEGNSSPTTSDEYFVLILRYFI